MLIQGTPFIDAALAQPKLEVATVVAGGVTIPQTYGGFEQAMKHRPFMLRSEGPWEHALQLPGRRRVAGVSGLLESFTVDDEALARVRENRAPRFYDRSCDFFDRAFSERDRRGAFK